MEPKQNVTSALTAALPPSASRHKSIPDEGRFLPGTLLGGRYRIIGLLGQGGMGEVYRGTDLTLGQSVALKFLPSAAVLNDALLERFHGEVRIARQVSHPNVCRVYDIGEAEGMPFISMEYVDGEDLATLLLRIGVIHRDLKPQNIMLNRRGEVILFAGLVFVLLRLGLDATISAVFFLNMLNGATLGTNLSTWYSSTGFATITVILALVFYAFRQSLGTQSITRLS